MNIFSEKGKKIDKAMFEVSFATSQLVEMLRKTKPGDVITYKAMSEMVGFPVQEKRGNLDTARRILIREYGMSFDPIRTVGLRRMEAGEIAPKVKNSQRRVHRIAKKNMQMLSKCVVYEKLTGEEQLEHNTAVSLTGALILATRHCVAKRIEASCSERQAKLPVGRVFALFER
jgi:hypothetical protein